MRKKPFSLTLENPCQQDWGSLPRQDGGLYCSDCKKVVHDFSTMSDEEIIKLFTKKSTGQLCGVFRADQLNRDLNPPIEKRYSFRPAKILLLSLFTFKFISPTKAAPPLTPAVNYLEQKKYAKVPNSISGKMRDAETGKPLANVVISLVGQHLSATSDSSGDFQLIIPDSIHGETFRLHIAKVYYKTTDTTIARTELPFELNLHLISTVVKKTIAHPPERVILGGVPPQQNNYPRQNHLNIFIFLFGFWQKLKMKFYKKSHI